MSSLSSDSKASAFSSVTTDEQKCTMMMAGRKKESSCICALLVVDEVGEDLVSRCTAHDADIGYGRQRHRGFEVAVTPKLG
jgi:hypothetical protein